MLTHTFLHLPGVGETSEQRLWRAGIRQWDDFLDADARGCLPGLRFSGLSRDILSSVEHFQRGDWNYFDRLLPAPHKWRALGDLGSKALYVDIETTGLGGDDQITVIGAYDGTDFRAFVAGRDLDAAREWIENHPLIVTFNGAVFDMPIIRARFPYNLFNHVHVDLRYPLKRLGLSGGLKKIERELGLDRSEETQGLDGWDAVRLWHAYQAGHEEALDLLIKYNREDVVNLKVLAEHVLRELSRSLPVAH